MQYVVQYWWWQCVGAAPDRCTGTQPLKVMQPESISGKTAALSSHQSNCGGCRPLLLPPFGEMRLDLGCKLGPDKLRQLLDGGEFHPLLPDSLDQIELRAQNPLGAQRPVERDGEAVGLVPDLLEKPEPGGRPA